MPALLIVILSSLIIGFTWLSRHRNLRLLETIEVVTLPEVCASQLGNRRDIVVYLPPGYHEAAPERYSVLYVNDGQDREVLCLRETLARLVAAGRIQPLLVVAIPTNAARLHEYGTAVALNSLGLGALAAAYTHFVVEELMPRIDAQFRTQPGAGFLGMSLGGLSAFDIAWNYPDRFAAVGVMSGSLWWRAGEDEARIDPGRRIPHSLVRRATQPPPYRLWFQAGDRDETCDRDGNGVIDAIQDTLELMEELAAVGCAPDDLAYVQVSGGRHDCETWARVLPDFLMWAFSPRPARQRT
jgi:enterochelin esterase-like enzyme